MDIVKKAVIKQTWQNGTRVPASRTVGGPDGLLAKLIPFDTWGPRKGMWARRYDGMRSVDCLGQYNPILGYSSFMERRYLPDGKYTEHGPLYVVYSYSTPIAWVTNFGEVKIPGEKYSNTTTHHQGLCRAWLGTFPCGHGEAMKDCIPWLTPLEWIGGEKL